MSQARHAAEVSRKQLLCATMIASCTGVSPQSGLAKFLSHYPMLAAPSEVRDGRVGRWRYSIVKLPRGTHTAIGCMGWGSSHATTLRTAVLITCSRPERKAAIEAMPPVCQPIPRQSANFRSSALTGIRHHIGYLAACLAHHIGRRDHFMGYAECSLRPHTQLKIDNMLVWLLGFFASGAVLRTAFPAETFPRLRGVNRADSAACPILRPAAPHLARPYDRHRFCEASHFRSGPTPSVPVVAEHRVCRHPVTTHRSADLTTPVAAFLEG